MRKGPFWRERSAVMMGGLRVCGHTLSIPMISKEADGFAKHYRR